MTVVVRNVIAIASVLFAVSGANAQGVPSPPNSTCPTTVTVAPDGSCCFDVIVRDVNNNPVAGASVRIDFSCTMAFCPTQPPGVIVVGNSVVATSDASGRARFCICASFTPPCSATISADGVVLCGNVPVRNDCPTPTHDASWGVIKVMYR